MQHKIEIEIKCDTPEQLVIVLEDMALRFKNMPFDKAPNDIMMLEDKDGKEFGYLYDIRENDNTDIYNNELEAKT